MLQTAIKKNSPYLLKTSSTSGCKHYTATPNETFYSNRIYTIRKLNKYSLVSELLFEEKFEDGEFLLSSDALNLYSNGETLDEAHNLMVERIESLHDDLNSDDRYSKRFLKIKDYLNSVIVNEKR
jgi:predicted RNase H-like HicB family nuclease